MTKYILFLTTAACMVLPFITACELAPAANTKVTYSNDSFVVTQVDTNLIEGEYRLDMQVSYTFNKVISEALDNGVPITIKVLIQVRPDNTWGWYSNIVDITKVVSIRYQPLTELYTVTHLPASSKRSFVTQESAIAALGEITDLPLIKRCEIKTGHNYFIHIKVFLDLEALPLPLRPLAHLTPSWNISSGWTIWPLKQ